MLLACTASPGLAACTVELSLTAAGSFLLALQQQGQPIGCSAAALAAQVEAQSCAWRQVTSEYKQGYHYTALHIQLGHTGCHRWRCATGHVHRASVCARKVSGYSSIGVSVKTQSEPVHLSTWCICWCACASAWWPTKVTCGGLRVQRPRGPCV